MTQVRVFVSSTWIDLEPEREAVEKIIHRMRQLEFSGMEYFGSRPESAAVASLEEVNRADLYVGIFGGRYGSGITEEEYRRAQARSLPCLLYFKQEAAIPDELRDSDPDAWSRLAALKVELSDSRHGHLVTPFSAPDELAAKVSADLHNWLFDHYLAPTLKHAAQQGELGQVQALVQGTKDQKALREALTKAGIAVGDDILDGLLALSGTTIINMFVGGIEQVRTDYAAHIRRYFDEYLGTARRPVPFGGRTAALQMLDEWLDTADAPPYSLLAAPAGRGKSALLVHWSRRLLARDDLTVIFVPISIRFATSLARVTFTALAAALARFYGDQVPSDINTPSEVWRGLVADYLSRPLPEGKRLLMILDGLDEAADWEAGPDLFPMEPPVGMRILVSARYLAGDRDSSGWLRRLGWDWPGAAWAMELVPLTREGVADVLNRMGFPLDRLGANVDIVAELHRLSKGDPLLVQLYVLDLWKQGEQAARLRPEDLGTLRPGLEGYFERWWQEQHRLWGSQTPLKEAAVQTILDLLSFALGPLRRDDILDALVPPEMGLTSWTLDEALRPLERFVIGDGREQGYVFSHPGLGEYFYGRLSARQRQSLESRFLGWGRQTLKALNGEQLSPKDVSPYLVQYYGTHLERAHSDIEDFLPLVHNGWHQAWHQLEGAYGGFLKDVQRIWRMAENLDGVAVNAGKPAPHLGIEIRCALCLASINSLASNITADLLRLLVQEEIWSPSQGLAYARQMPEDYERAQALSVLAADLPEPLLADALIAAQAIQDKGNRARALSALAPHLPESQRSKVLAEALIAARAIQDEGNRARALSALAPHLPKPLLADALTAARAIQDEGFQSQALATLAIHLLEPQRSEMLTEALRTAWAIQEEWPRAWALTALADYLPEPLLADALTAARIIQNEGLRAQALSALAAHLPEPQRSEMLTEALRTARAIQEKWPRARTLAILADHLPEPQRSEMLTEALRTARAIQEEWHRAWALTALAAHLPKPLLTKALTVARTLQHEEPRVWALTALTPLLSKPLLQSKLLTEVPMEAQIIQDKEYQAQALTALAPHLPESQHSKVLAEALTAVQAIQEEWPRAWALTALAAHLPKPLLAKALMAARLLQHEGPRAQALTALAPHLPEPLLEEALTTAKTLQHEGPRAQALTALAPHLPEPLLEEALTAAQAIQDKKSRAQQLVAQATHPPEPLLTETLIAASAMQERWLRTEALTKLAPPLTQLPATKLYPLWRETLHVLSRRTRADLLTDIAQLVPVITTLGGTEAVAETFSAIQDVTRWWP